MPTAPPARSTLCLLSLILLATTTYAQNLPPSAPTQPPPAPTQPAQPAHFIPPDQPAYRARVDFAANQLSVTAENSSLNSILKEISRLTGMKITGSVSDERVYGTYGPGTTHQVLDQLLDGTSSNVLLREGSNHVVDELVFTPRTGAASPPNPNANREELDLPPQLGGRRRGRPFDNHRSQETSPQQFPNPQSPTPQPPDPSAEPSPNGVKTPAQIYDDLTKQQQQQATPPN